MDWKKEFTQSEMKNLEERYYTKIERTRKRGLEFNLTLDDWFMMGKKLLGMGTCDYTDMPFHMGTVAGYNPKYPTVERIDDKKGYVRGNVCVVMRRANELKDCLVDKKTAITIIEPLDREIVQAMMLNMSKEHMEKLKTKYIPAEENEMNTDEIMQESNNNISVSHDKAPVEVEAEPKEAISVSLPEDVAVALAYANYCNTFANVGMKVSVTYAQFKAKYIRNTCAMTGEKLTGEPKSILILDLDVGFAKDNFIIVSKKMETAMTQLMIQTGLSLPKITAMMNKVV
uniref:HNH endonuclease n=1 Tax=Salmonella phage vB_SEnST11_KE23 TaxID=3161174 RepID=A0AAU8GET1_9CAUD